MPDSLDARRLDSQRQIEALLGRGWRWDPAHPDVLLHPADHALRVRYDADTGALSLSPELDRQLSLVIPTPAGKSRVFRR